MLSWRNNQEVRASSTLGRANLHFRVGGGAKHKGRTSKQQLSPGAARVRFTHGKGSRDGPGPSAPLHPAQPSLQPLTLTHLIATFGIRR